MIVANIVEGDRKFNTVQVEKQGRRSLRVVLGALSEV